MVGKQLKRSGFQFKAQDEGRTIFYYAGIGDF
jgi:hypothetical protein